MAIAWGEWKPDVSSYDGDSTENINNVFPRGDGYGPIASLSPWTGALPAACRGAFLALKSDGTVALFAGTSTDLYLLNNTTLAWASVSKSAAAYSVGAAAQWQFVQSGSDVIALNANNPPQRYTLGSSAIFADLAGSPPQAAFGTMVNEYLVLSGLNSTPYRIAWSATGDITGWTAGVNGSDVQDFADGGVCRGIAGGEFGWLFQDNCIRRMIFVGGTTRFQFTRLTEDMGLRAPYSLTRAADRVYFLSRSGFQELTDSGQITPIGKEKFDRTFFTNWDSGSPQMLIGAHDPQSSRVLWFYKSTTGTAGVFDKGIVYDWNINRAAPITGISGEYVVPLAQPGTTLDALDALGFTSIDAMTVSLDDIAGSAGAQFSMFDTSHKAGFLSGSFLEATMETASQGSPQRTFVRGARPITDAPTVYGSVLYSQRLGDTATQSTEQLMNAVGFTPHRADGHMVRYRNRIPAGTSWTYSAGVEPDSSPTGMR